MSLARVHIAGYRSIRAIHLPLSRLSVLVGGNGVGKTNLYRALELIQAAAVGTLATEIALEGGLASLFWAGERNTHEQPVLVLEANLDDLTGSAAASEFAPTYRIEVGFPPREATAAFPLEAQVKREAMTILSGGRRVVLMEREGPAVWARDPSGKRMQAADGLLASETALSMLGSGFPEVDAACSALSQWRFHHSFRTDADSPLRRPTLAVTSPLLAQDGSNLAAVLATLVHIRGDRVDLDEAIELAFPGARLQVELPQQQASFSMLFPDLPKRPFAAQELSDGTLQFIALMGALLSYRLPPFIALNEPETSLHPSLLPALARIITRAAGRTQIWVVTHSEALAEALREEAGVAPRQVIREDGGTWIKGLTKLGTYSDD